MSTQELLVKIVQRAMPVCISLWILWSRVYRFIYHRKYKGIPLPRGLSPDDVATALAKLRWQRDSWKEMFDVCGSPNYVQFCLEQVNSGKEQPVGALDCDDFACWAATVMDEKYLPQIMSVVWVDYNHNVNGHCICVYWVGSEAYHVGNWGVRGPFLTAEAACASVWHEAGVPTERQACFMRADGLLG